MPNLSITERLLSLSHLNKPALAKLWQRFFESNPPPGMRKELMLQFLAYRIQEQEFGGFSDRTRRRLRELANSIASDTSSSTSARLAIKPGTRLIRQWKDQVHMVNVEEGNYEYRDSRYESLSEIARLITGTRWSGPLFFGLKSKRAQTSKEVA
jgi:hypothetical protein